MNEPELIAARLASSPWFPIAVTSTVKERAWVGRAEADGNVVTITMTNAAGTATRVYQARVELVSPQCRHCTVPVDSGDTCTFCASYVPPEPAGRDFDLLAPVPVPAGVTAGLWRVDELGHLVRDLSDGRVQAGHGGIVGQGVTPA